MLDSALQEFVDATNKFHAAVEKLHTLIESQSAPAIAQVVELPEPKGQAKEKLAEQLAETHGEKIAETHVEKLAETHVEKLAETHVEKPVEETPEEKPIEEPPTVTLAEMRSALVKVSKDKGPEVAREILKSFGAESLSDVEPAMYADVLSSANGELEL